MIADTKIPARLNQTVYRRLKIGSNLYSIILRIHVLGLDAVAVAICWQRWWTLYLKVTLSWPHTIILGCCTWIIYLMDRGFDTRYQQDLSSSHHSPSANLCFTARHAFAYNQWHWIRYLIFCLLLTNSLLTFHYLTRFEFWTGCLFAGTTSTYFYLTHCQSRFFVKFKIPKELFVSILFVLGTLLFPYLAFIKQTQWVAQPIWERPEFWLQFTFLIFLFFLNCALITKWESYLFPDRDRHCLLNQQSWIFFYLNWIALLFTSIFFVIQFFYPILIPFFFSTLSLYLLDKQSHKLSPNFLRISADVSLLTPCFYYLYLLC